MLKKHDKILHEALLQDSILPKEIVGPVIKEIEASGRPLAEVLVEKGLVSEKEILDIFSKKLNIFRFNLKEVSVDKSVIEDIPVKIASYYKFFPLKIIGNVLTIAVSLPLDIRTQDEIRAQLGYDIEIVLVTSREIAEFLREYYGIAAETLQGIESKEKKDSGDKKDFQDISSEEVEDIEKLAGDASVIRLVNQIILEGWKKRATDIHLEPYRDKVFIRYRIDGVLYDTNVSPSIKKFLKAIVSRIKIMSNLNIVERRLPQDGRAIVKVQEDVLDLRISTIPTPFGESLVIRILPVQMLFSLEKLGLAKTQLQIFERLIQKPHGIIFVTGPTGSGKTTTLYACLSRINTKERKIITIEDPIEYEIAGVTQMQVMPEIGLDFARGLRSILRHDPDVIMVGEVRDLETAGIAIRVALTGHLIFSTLHTNDAASGVARLVDIGVEPYLVASSVDAFIAQRLLRTICPECKYEDKTVPDELKNLIIGELGLKSKTIKIFRGKGCNNCNSTGFFGRTAIYEILLIDDKIKELILKNSSSDEIRKMAISQGMNVLRQDGWQKVAAGLTTPEEVMQVAPVEESGVIDKSTKLFLSDSMPKTSDSKSLKLDRRVYKRVDKKINLRYKVYNSHEELRKGESKTEEFTVVKNISAGGLLFVSTPPISITSILELKIELPDYEEPIQCLGKVVRIGMEKGETGYDVSICFLDMASVQRARLNRYVEEQEG